jgi:hypothetical protein
MSRAEFLPKPPARQQLYAGHSWSHNCFIIAQLRGYRISIFDVIVSYNEQSLIEIDAADNATEVLI